MILIGRGLDLRGRSQCFVRSTPCAVFKVCWFEGELEETLNSEMTEKANAEGEQLQSEERGSVIRMEKQCRRRVQAKAEARVRKRMQAKASTKPNRTETYNFR